jgi:dynein heavy chain
VQEALNHNIAVYFVLQVTEESLRFLMFGNFMDMHAATEDKRYEEIRTLEAFINVAEAAVEEYNATHKGKMDIVLFRYWQK